MSHFRRWLLFGTLGLALTGAGLSLAIEAAFVKHSNEEGSLWILYGTLALIVFNIGIAIIGDAVYARLQHNNEKKKSK